MCPGHWAGERRLREQDPGVRGPGEDGGTEWGESREQAISGDTAAGGGRVTGSGDSRFRPPGRARPAWEGGGGGGGGGPD